MYNQTRSTVICQCTEIDFHILLVSCNHFPCCYDQRSSVIILKHSLTPNCSPLTFSNFSNVIDLFFFCRQIVLVKCKTGTVATGFQKNYYSSWTIWTAAWSQTWSHWTATHICSWMGCASFNRESQYDWY